MPYSGAIQKIFQARYILLLFIFVVAFLNVIYMRHTLKPSAANEIHLKNCSGHGVYDGYCVCDFEYTGLHCEENTPHPRELHHARESRFEYIFHNGFWSSNESVSGPGSNLQQTERIRAYIPHIFQAYAIRSMFDIPCGDVNWIKHINLGGIEYVGADIVSKLIYSHRKLYKNRKFFVADLVEQVPYKPFDLVLCRDALVHLNTSDIARALRNLNLSGSKYLLATTFPNHQNVDQVQLPGMDWRPLNLQAEPFNLPNPLEIYNEGYFKKGEEFSDKSLGLWKLPVPIPDKLFLL